MASTLHFIKLGGFLVFIKQAEKILILIIWKLDYVVNACDKHGNPDDKSVTIRLILKILLFILVRF